MTRDGDTYPVRWAGEQTIMTLPEQLDVSNAGQVREQLLSLINRGATALIADMTVTLSCDHAGVDALVRAYQRAIMSGTQLRLVVTAPIVQRVLSVNGLDRLISVYPSLEAAVAAGARNQQSPASDPADRTEELLNWIVTSIFDIGLSLQTAIDLRGDAAGRCMTEALRRLDDVVREVRQHMFAERAHHAQPARQSPPDIHEHVAQAAERAASLQEFVVQRAHILQTAAADTAALLERRADLVGQPARIDYPAEIKRWRALANQAEQMARRWEQRP